MLSQSFKNILVVIVLLLISGGFFLMEAVLGRIFIALLLILAYSAGMVSEKTKNQRFYAQLSAIVCSLIAGIILYSVIWLLVNFKGWGYAAIAAPFWIIGGIILSVLLAKSGLKYWRLAKSL